MENGGDFDLEHILEFNGGLFDGRPPLALEQAKSVCCSPRQASTGA